MQPIIGGFAAFGFVFLAVGGGILLVQRRFRQQTVTTQGTIVGLPARVPYSGGPEFGLGMVYHPVVRFVTADGQSIEAESRTGSNPPPGRVGQTVTIRYDPTTPQRFSVARTSLIAGLIAWVFVVVGGLIFSVSCMALAATLKP